MRSLARLSFAVLTALVMSVCFSATRTAVAQTNGTSGIIISEFRLDGPNGSGDEFVEIVNNTNAPKTVVSSDAPLFTGFSVWGIVSGAPRKICTIPNGTLLNPGQHYLCARVTAGNVGGYELGNYATPDQTTTVLQPVNSLAFDGGIALFSSEDVIINNDGSFFSGLGQVFREDAVGFKKRNSDTFPLSFAPAFREGVGLNPIGPQDCATRNTQNPSDCREYSFVRKHGLQGTAPNQTFSGPVYNDANDNLVDFVLVSNVGDLFNVNQSNLDDPANTGRLGSFAGSSFDPSPAGFAGSEAATVPIFGAPGPQSRNSPTERNYNSAFIRSLFDTGTASNQTPNTERGSGIVCGGPRGDLILRFSYKNQTTLTQSNLRVRWIDMPAINRSSLGTGAGTSVLDLLDSTAPGGFRRVFVNSGKDTNPSTIPAVAAGSQNDPAPSGDGITNATAAGGAGVKTARGTYVEGVTKTPSVSSANPNPQTGFGPGQLFTQVNPTWDTTGDINTQGPNPCRVGGLNSATVSTAPAGATSASPTTTAIPALAPSGVISLEHRFGVIRAGSFVVVGIIESN